MYDVIIVGAGPAGLNAAVYCARYLLNVFVIGELAGGMMSEAHEICNFLSYKKISGFDLAVKMQEQVKDLGVEIKNEKVVGISKEKKDFFVVKTKSGVFEAKRIIYAAGSEKNTLGLVNEENFIGKGISYCATCDAAFYKNKVVGVVGGSDSALTAALLLAGFADRVFIFYRKDRFFRAEPAWVEQVKKNEKIECVFNSEIAELDGKNRLESVKLISGDVFELDGLFIEIGSSPVINLFDNFDVELDDGRIAVDKNKKTSVDGFFAAGDVTNTPLQQIVTAAADGAVAARSVFNDLKSVSK